MAKKIEPKPCPERYEKSDLAIKGTFYEVMNVYFIKPKEDKPKDYTDGLSTI